MAAPNHGSLTVPTLLTSSVRAVVVNFISYNYEDDRIVCLPLHIKDRCLTLMSKRGLLKDSNIALFLHKKLQRLDLSESDVTDVSLSKIGVCPELKKIDLNAAKVPRTGITSEGIITLSQHCQHLQVVYLRRCIQVTDDAITALSENCRQLREINLGGCVNITDQSLAALGNNSHFLKSLDFSRANVTDDGVFALVNGNCSQTLKEIHMGNCKDLTDEAVEAVTQFCPNINILIFHGCPLITEQARMALEEVMIGGTGRMKQLTWTIY